MVNAIFNYEKLANCQWKLSLSAGDYHSESIHTSRTKCVAKIKRYLELNRITKAEIEIREG